MGAGVATVGRRPYAVGLYWENSPSGRVSQAAKEAARQPGQQAEFYAVRAGSKSGRLPQFGLSQVGAGHKAGTPVFAACLANQQPGSWAGAFRLREGTVVTVVRDDLILPDGDQFFTDEAEARDRLLQEIGFGGLQRIYAPEAWSIPNADTMPVSLLVNDVANIRLRAVDIPKIFILLGVAGVGLLLAALGIGWYIQAENAREEAEQRAHDEELKRLRELAQKNVPGIFKSEKPEYPPPEKVWENKPLPKDVMQACSSATLHMPAAIAGWEMGELKCNGASATVNWHRGRGFSAPPQSFIINETGSSATYSVSLPELKARGHEDILDPDDITRLYLGANWPGTINRAQDDPPPKPPPDYRGEWSPPPAPWIKRSFTVTVPALSQDSLAFLDGLPGVVVDSLRFSDVWTIEGVIYEKRR